jgi:hypothetical protein
MVAGLSLPVVVAAGAGSVASGAGSTYTLGTSYPWRAPGPVSWLAAGDSYSSGEGIPGTGTGDDTCAQSALAYGPKAAEILHTQRGWEISPLSFTACTGSTLHEFYAGGDQANHGLGPQWNRAVQSGPSGGRFDVVSMSFGGNDIGFEDVLKGCLGPTAKALTWSALVSGEPVDTTPCETTAAELRRRIDDLLAGRSWAHDLPYVSEGSATLADFFVDVATRAVTDRGVLAVVGYPQLFAPTAQWGDWRGGRCNMVSRIGADALNDVANYFDQALQRAANDAQARAGSGRVVYVSRYELFHQYGESHELCSGRTEYLNGITLGVRDGSFRLAHSFHPNEVGHQVTAEVVAGYIAYRLDPPASPTTEPSQTTTPSPPPVSDGTSHFEIGDRFVASCVVAWPTAPVRTTTTIQMRMSCNGVPQQYLFVDVVYPDPNLQVTPSTGYMQVEGTIADMATSEFGYRTLIVQADRILLP